MLRQIAISCILLAASAAARAQEPTAPPTVEAGASLVEVFADQRFYEGPSWCMKEGKLYFTAFGGPSHSQILRLQSPGKATVWFEKSEGVNGTYLSLDGRLLGAQGNARRIVSIALGGDKATDIKTVATSQLWIGPNDVCQTAKGVIYFTDPDFKKRTKSSIFRIDAGGNTLRTTAEMKLPNGIIASNDGKTLYIADSHEKLWRSYLIKDDGSLGEGKVFFDPDTPDRSDPDGMSIDEQGNLYFTGRGGVWVVSPAGKALGLIKVKEFVTNCTFGGDNGKTLYLTCDGKVYSLAMTVKGGAFMTKK